MGNITETSPFEKLMEEKYNEAYEDKKFAISKWSQMSNRYYNALKILNKSLRNIFDTKEECIKDVEEYKSLLDSENEDVNRGWIEALEWSFNNLDAAIIKILEYEKTQQKSIEFNESQEMEGKELMEDLDDE